MSNRLPRRRCLNGTRIAAAAVLTVVLGPATTLAAGTTPKSGKWVGKDTNPSQNQVSGKPTFNVTNGGRMMKKFTIPDVSKYCAFIGVSAGPVYIPKAKVHGGRVNVKYNYGPANFQAQYRLTGRFASSNVFKGEVKGTKTCVFDVKLRAHPK
jgi:hypothetical protein